MPKTLIPLLTAAAVCALNAGAAIAQAEAEQDTVIVVGRYLSLDQVNAVKTPTPVLNLPQSLSIVTRDQIENQAFDNLGDVLRYTPGLSISQGEGHRDSIIIRGNQTTADFFLNGMRDDVQYYRPLYNIDRIEILRGSNALLFGRGGGGGVINRVTKDPQIGETFTQAAAGVDTFGAYDISVDTNLALGDAAALRLNAYVEEFSNHRDAFGGERYAINPTLGIDLGPQTDAVLYYEHVDDDRVVDRGVPSVSVAGGPDRPLRGFDDTFFGSPDENRTTLDADILRLRVNHTFNDMLRGDFTAHYADYDKLYQNIYPAGLNTSVTPALVTLDGYRDTTQRENLIFQGNLVGEFQTGRIGHTLLIGAEYADQSTDNARDDNLFAASNDDQISVPLTDPLTVPDFAFVTPVRDRSSDVEVSSLYIQDQIDLTDAFKLIAGLRFDRFDISALDRRAALDPGDDGRRARVDEEVSSRLGFIYKPAENVSIYASYSETFLPSAGDQFLTLSTTSEDLKPQVFENREVGLKWDMSSNMSLTGAVFRLERGQFTSVDPDNPAIVTTVPGSTTDGLELEFTGTLTDRWTLNAGYSYLDGQVDGGTFHGNTTRQTPEHMASLWNLYEATDKFSLAIGLTYQDSFFVLEDNAVEVPSYTRVDAAAYYDLTDRTRVQLNVENLFDIDYFPDAHSNDNISTGAPLNARFTLRHRF